MDLNVALTGQTLAITSGTEVQVIDPAGTLATLTIVMPASAFDGQKVTLVFSAIVTALTMSAPGTTVKNPLTSAASTTFATWKYDKANLIWWRVG